MYYDTFTSFFCSSYSRSTSFSIFDSSFGLQNISLSITFSFSPSSIFFGDDGPDNANDDVDPYRYSGLTN